MRVYILTKTQIVLAVGVGAAASGVVRHYDSASRITIEGEVVRGQAQAHVTYQDGLPDTLQRLVQEMRLHPRANVYVVRRVVGKRTNWLHFDAFDYFYLTYNRRRGTLKDACGSGDTAAQWDAVTDKALVAIAADNTLMSALANQRISGSSCTLLRDLEKYHCINTQP